MDDMPRFAGHRDLAREREKSRICYLCGMPLTKPTSADHVPPKQFFAKSVRDEHAPQLLTLPTHAACNTSHQADEDYVVATLLPFVNGSYAGTALFHEHAERFARRPKHRGLAVKVLSEFERRPSGLVLPNNQVAKRMDGDRVARVLFKIARGLFWLHEGLLLPADLHTSQRVYGPDEDPGPVMLLLADAPRLGQYPGVFDYAFKVARLESEEQRGCLFGMLLWDRLFARVGFELPPTLASAPLISPHV